MGEKWKNLPFLGKTCVLVSVTMDRDKWYRYQKLVVPEPIHRTGLVPVLIKVVTVPMLPAP